MTPYPHLAHAPITEAIIDVRVRRQSKEEVPLEVIAPLLGPDYPGPLEGIQGFATTIDMQRGVVEVVKHTGWRTKSVDDRSVVQFRVDGFTFNRLNPYTSWDEIFPEMQRLWQVYVALYRPDSVTRLATRYVNKMELPQPVADLAKYLTAPPTFPTGLATAMRGFLTRLIVSEPEQNRSAIVMQASEGTIGDDYIVILLDVDAFREVDLPVDSDEIPSILAGLRDFKNDIFFGSVTPDALRLFS